MKPRQLAIALILGGACWLWLQAPAEPAAAAAPSRAQRKPGMPPPELLVLRPRTQLAHEPSGRQRDLFAAQRMPEVAGSAEPAPAPVPAPPPTAPALPFAYLGKKIEAGEWEVFLAQGEQAFVVREGSLIESRYRIDAIAPPELRLTYLPLGEKQVMSIGGLP